MSGEINREPEKINGMGDYLLKFLQVFLARLDHIHVKDYYWKNTITLDTLDVGTIEFDLSLEKKKALLKEGYHKTKKFLDDKLDLIN